MLWLEFSLCFQETPYTKDESLSIQNLDYSEKIGKLVIN